MEVPFLTISTVLSLNDKVSIIDVINISSLSQSRNNMEIFVYNESVVSVPLTGGWFTLPVLGVDEIPLLISFSVEVNHVDISVFSINAISNIHDLIGFLEVSEEWSSPSEELEPS
jgi:hypothetical protein